MTVLEEILNPFLILHPFLMTHYYPLMKEQTNVRVKGPFFEIINNIALPGLP